MRFFRSRIRELEARAEEARLRAQDARQEAELSREREKHIEETVVEPLRHAGSHNQFADIIYRSLFPSPHPKAGNGTRN